MRIMRQGKTGVKKASRLRILAASAASVCLFFPLLEGGLRFSGYGYHAGYLAPLDIGGKPHHAVNPDFFRTFFPGALVPYAEPIAIPETKEDGVYRIFILGESAAAGIPDPSFGFPRMLEAMLRARHPGIRFQVRNLAVTAINSHVILRIAKAAAREKPDLFLVYMGNNEVIGPYGPGTVFTPYAGRNAVIGAVAALKSTRTGQLLEGILDLARPGGTESASGGSQTPGVGKGEPRKWEGMEMFLSRTVTFDDERMESVHRNFGGNLQGIYAAARAAGAGIIFSTVAVNFRDLPPFASRHRPGLSARDSADWEGLCDSAAYLAAAADPPGERDSAALGSALALYRRALRLDRGPAELHYQIGRLLLRLGRPDSVRHPRGHDSSATAMLYAMELDALRFRADSEMNILLHNIVRTHAGEGVWMADADSAFAEAAPDGIPGREFFYEHVHLRPEGSYLLARTFAPWVDSALAASGRLPGTAGQAGGIPWPTLAEVRAALALTGWNELGMAEKILALVRKPPFTDGVSDGEAREASADAAGVGASGAFVRAARAERTERTYALEREVDSLRRYASNDSLQTALEQYQAAIQANPSDPILRRNLGELFYACDYLPQAAEQFRAALEALPQDTRTRQRLAKTLAEQADFRGAVSEYQTALKFAPGSVEIHNGLANALAGAGEHDQAVAHYLKALVGGSAFPEVHFNLARTYISLGRIGDAIAQLEAALREDPHFGPASRELERLKASGTGENGKPGG
jgi:Tfp pilus assembly protein PilF